MGLGPERKDSKTFGTTVYGLTHPIVQSVYQYANTWPFLGFTTFCTFLPISKALGNVSPSTTSISLLLKAAR